MSQRRGPELTDAQRGGIIALWKAKKKYREISDILGGISISTIGRTVQRFKKHNTIKSLPCSGRPPILSAHDQRKILRLIRADPFAPYHVIASRSGCATTRQVAELSRDFDYHRRVARRKPFIPEETIPKRVQWSKENRKRNWQEVLWTDEVAIETGERPARKMVTRRPGEENLRKHIVPTFRSGRKSIMAWSCVAQDWKGPLIRLEMSPRTVNKRGRAVGGGLNAAGYAAQVVSGPLKEAVATLEAQRGCKILVVEDGAPAHRGQVVDKARTAAGIHRLTHPPSSPDLNPIEPLWSVLKTRVYDIPGSRNSLEALWSAAQKVWDELTIEEVNNHTGKMEARVAAVREAKGWHTDF